MTGDLHNGGLAVRRIQASDSRFWFHKPRTLFWEWLFFGKESPLTKFFSKSDLLFQLEIEQSNDLGSGKSLAVPEATSICRDAFFNFGYLLAYAHLFGIQDLFIENVIRSHSGVLAIDVEIVFSKFFLPHESSLLPFRTVDMSRSGLSLLLGEAKDPQPEQVFEIIRGYISLLTEARHSSTAILNVFKELPLAEIPVRILLRPTPEYIGTTVKAFHFLPEEELQLKRGDIPYFFKYLGNDAVYFYSDGVKQSVTSPLPKQIEMGLKNLVVDPSDIVNEQRIAEHLMPTGVLFLLRKLLPKGYEGNFRSAQFFSEIKIGELKIEIEFQSFSCKR